MRTWCCRCFRTPPDQGSISCRPFRWSTPLYPKHRGVDDGGGPAAPYFPPLGTVLMPSGFLPLHLFEERYRRMIVDLLEGDREFGVVLIRGW
ncbi:MAG: hypothetical protein CM1200mP26_11820 [Acidimicrobiales bacterium]|nr:MAG: hypothetical protein CM1200mP26_11820 [Acidimicrobiales bacterium]